MFISSWYLVKNNKYSERKFSHHYMYNCSLPPPFHLCLRHGFSSSHSQKMLNTGRDLQTWVKGKNHLISYYLVLHFINRWALAWEHAPGCYLNEDAEPLQTALSKEWPSRLHSFTYSRIHDNKVPCPLPASTIEYLIDRYPNVNHSLSGKQSRRFAFSFFILCLHTLYVQLGWVTGHAHFFFFLAWVFVCAFSSF